MNITVEMLETMDPREAEALFQKGRAFAKTLDAEMTQARVCGSLGLFVAGVIFESCEGDAARIAKTAIRTTAYIQDLGFAEIDAENDRALAEARG